MKHTKEIRVYYQDTDAYKVVWHGSYLKWFEEGRVDFCDMMGLTMEELDSGGITLPVVDIHLRYKASALIHDRLIVETAISNIRPMSVTFSQVIKNKKTGITHIQAEITVVAVDHNGKLIKRLPEKLYKTLEKAMLIN